MAIIAILCDLDGTLVDSSQNIAAAFQHAWQSIVGGIPPSAAMIVQHIGKPLAEMVSEFGVKLSPSLLRAFVAVYRQMYSRQNLHLTRPYPEVVPSLQALSAYKLGVVTTKEPDQAEMVLRRLALTAFFQHIQGGTCNLRLKPAPDTVIAALAALHCTPAQALMVGDTSADVVAGKAAGTMTCAVTYGFGGREVLLQSSPDFVIDSFGQLPELVRVTNLRSRVGWLAD
jgi:HAD superfamily hydrolase (TIGR01509 family)